MTFQAKAPGKLILIGEYAVLEGANALVCAIDRFAYVKLEQTERFLVTAPSVDIDSVPFEINDRGFVLFPASVGSDLRKRLTFFKSTFEYTWRYLKGCQKPSGPYHIFIDTEAFYSTVLQSKLGFGSSASLTVALAKSMFMSVGMDVSEPVIIEKLFRLSLAAHRNAQGNLGSGIDIAASTYGGVLEYRMGVNTMAEQIAPVSVKAWTDLPMLTIWSGNSESTRKMVSGVDKLKSENPARYREIITEMTHVSENGCYAYSQHNSETFLDCIKKYGICLRMLGDESGMPIISEIHHRIGSTVEKNGGVYKPSGAGSGDIGVAFAESADKLVYIRRRLEENNFNCIDLSVAL